MLMYTVDLGRSQEDTNQKDKENRKNKKGTNQNEFVTTSIAAWFGFMAE